MVFNTVGDQDTPTFLYLTDYLNERDLDWEAFDSLSKMADLKKEKLISDWRFVDALEIEDVKKYLMVSKMYRLTVNGNKGFLLRNLCLHILFEKEIKCY